MPDHAIGAVDFVELEEIAADETFRLRPDGDVTDLATAIGRLGQLVPVDLRPWPAAASDGRRWQVVAGFRRLAASRLLARERVLARIHGELSDRDSWALALSEGLLHEPLAGQDLESLRERLRKTGVAPWAEELVDEAVVRAPVSPELRERFHEFLGSNPASQPQPAQTERGLEGEVEEGAPPPQPEISSAAESPPADTKEEPPVQSDERFAPTPFGGETGELESPAVAQVEMSPEELVADLLPRIIQLNHDLATAVEVWADLPVEERKHVAEQARYIAALVPFMETEPESGG